MGAEGARWNFFPAREGKVWPGEGRSCRPRGCVLELVVGTGMAGDRERRSRAVGRARQAGSRPDFGDGRHCFRRSATGFTRAGQQPPLAERGGARWRRCCFFFQIGVGQPERQIPGRGRTGDGAGRCGRARISPGGGGCSCCSTTPSRKRDQEPPLLAQRGLRGFGITGEGSTVKARGGWAERWENDGGGPSRFGHPAAVDAAASAAGGTSQCSGGGAEGDGRRRLFEKVGARDKEGGPRRRCGRGNCCGQHPGRERL